MLRSLVFAISSIVCIDIFQKQIYHFVNWGDENGAIMVGGRPVSLGMQTIIL